MKHTIKLITALSAIMLGILLVAPSCKKDDSAPAPAYQKDWVITTEGTKACYAFREDGVLLFGPQIDEATLNMLQSISAETDKISQEDKDFLMSLKAGDYVCATGTYVALPNSNDTEGALVCMVMKETVQMTYKMLSDTAIELTLVTGEESDKNITAVGVAQDINIRVVTDNLANIIFYK